MADMTFAHAAQMMAHVREASIANTQHLNITTNSLNEALRKCGAVLQAATGTRHEAHIKDCIGALEVAKDALSDARATLVKAATKAADASASLRGGN